MVNRVPTLSPLQVLYTGYPDSVRYQSGQLTRVRDVSNPNGDRRDQLSVRIRQAVAARMTSELARREAHEAVRQQRYASRRPQSDTQAGAHDADLVLPAMFDDEPDLEHLPRAAPVALPVRAVQARDISLIEVEDDATVRTRTYPRSAHCNGCGHFLLLAPERPPSTLTCPCCHGGTLVIEPIIFICGRCASRRELFPPGERVAPQARGRKRLKIEENLGCPPPCPECSNGHIHLDKHGTNSVSRWEWRCVACSNYVEVLQEPCGMCGIPATATERSDYILMQAIPAAASNALQPLIFQGLFVHDQEIDLSTLRQQAIDQMTNWPDAFQLSAAVGSGVISTNEHNDLVGSCLRDAYLVNDVRVVTVTYGYKAGSAANHPQTPVESGDRLAHFFRDPEGLARFLTYSVSSQGAALVLEFDPVSLVERLARTHSSLIGRSWGDIVNQETRTIGTSLVRELLRIERRDLIAYSALHAVEHAILTNAVQLTGTEALTSRMFFSAATIVISERSRIGRGGVIQLVNRGTGLVQLFNAARDQALGCAQGCRDGCPTCIYVRDTYCTQPVEELGAVWMPPNSLLSRRGSASILAVTTPV